MRRLLPALLLTLLLAPSAEALVLDSGDGQGNTTPPADDPGWSFVGRVGGPTGVYLGNGWVLTANHVGTNPVDFDGIAYPVVPGSTIQLQNPDTSFADLKVFRIDPYPDLGLLPIRATTPPVNAYLTFIAVGLSRGAATSWMGINGWLWGATTGKRWGTNRLTATGIANGTLGFSASFTHVGTMGSTTHEAIGANGDSGGAAFVKNGSTWELAGLLFAISSFGGQPYGTSLYGNLTWSADLSQYRDQLIEITRPECANEVDDDGDDLVDWPDDSGCSSELDVSEFPDQDDDGVDDSLDDCLTLANPGQQDADQDGYGNLCDADFNDNGIVGANDVAAIAARAGFPAAGNEEFDLDSSGAVGANDVARAASASGLAPGPSGLACAGTAPCP